MEGFWEVIKVSKDIARMGVGAREGEIDPFYTELENEGLAHSGHVINV